MLFKGCLIYVLIIEHKKEHITYQKSISKFENGLSESLRICIREF